MVALEVAQFMTNYGLGFWRRQQIQQGGVDDNEGLFAPHGKGVGVGNRMLTDIKLWGL